MDRIIKRKNTNIMNGVIYWILAIIFVAIGAYVIGLHRGYKTYEHEYDRGWSECLDWCRENYEMTEIEEMTNNLYNREQKAKALIEQLDDLFSEDFKE